MRLAEVFGELSEAYIGAIGKCIECDDKVIAKCGPELAWHWSHPPGMLKECSLRDTRGAEATAAMETQERAREARIWKQKWFGGSRPTTERGMISVRSDPDVDVEAIYETEERWSDGVIWIVRHAGVPVTVSGLTSARPLLSAQMFPAVRKNPYFGKGEGERSKKRYIPTRQRVEPVFKTIAGWDSKFRTAPVGQLYLPGGAWVEAIDPVFFDLEGTEIVLRLLHGMETTHVTWVEGERHTHQEAHSRGICRAINREWFHSQLRAVLIGRPSEAFGIFQPRWNGQLPIGYQPHGARANADPKAEVLYL